MDSNTTTSSDYTTPLPNEVTLNDAQWTQQGQDLIIHLWSDTFTVPNYFAHPHPLMLADGSQLSATDVQANLSTQPNYQLAADGGSNFVPQTAQIGIASTVVNGPISVEDIRGHVREVSQGDPIYLNDTIQTSAKGYVKITLEDGTLFQLGPLSRVQMEKYSYISEEEGGHFESNVFVGFFRFISGKLSGEDEGQQHSVIKTPSATIGIRGSEIDGQIDVDGSTTILHSEGLIDITPLFSQDTISVYQPGTRIFIDNNSLQRDLASPLFIEEFRGNLDTINLYDESGELLLAPPPAFEGRGPNGAPPPHLQDLRHLPQQLVEKLQAGEQMPFTRQPPSPAPTSDQGEFRPDLLARFLQGQGQANPEASSTQTPHPFDGLASLPEDKLALLQKLRQGDSPLAERLDKVLERLESKLAENEANEHEHDRLSVANERTKNLLITANAIPNETPTLGDNEFLEDNAIVATFPEGIMERLSNLQTVLLQQPTNGSVEDNYNGTLTYVPVANFVGEDQFGVRLTGDEDFLLQTVTVTRSNVVLPEPLTETSILGTPEHGQLFINADNTVSYVPEANYVGSDFFTYQASAEAEPVIVELQVFSVNDAPDARADGGFVIDEDARLLIPVSTLLENDSDVDGDPLSIIAVGRIDGVTYDENGNAQVIPLQYGSVEYDAETNIITFDSPADFNGELVFSYQIADPEGAADIATVSITVNPVNDAPLATADEVTLLNGNTLISNAQLLFNDTDADGDSLQIIQVDSAENGSVTLTSNGVVFTPTDDTVTAGSFRYTVTDGVLSNSAVVSVQVGELDGSLLNRAPVAVNDNRTLGTGLAFVIHDLLANDIDPDGDTLRIVSVNGANNGSVTLGDDNTVIFTRPDGEMGSFTGGFTYTITDDNGNFAEAEVIINGDALSNIALQLQDDVFNITSGQRLQLGTQDLLQNDLGDGLTVISVDSARDGTVSLNADGSLSFEPSTDFLGNAGFSYTVQDSSGNTATANVTVTVSGLLNQAPVAVADQFATLQNSALSIQTTDLLANDTDANVLQTLTVDSVSDGIGGTVSLQSGVVVFTPNADFVGTATFSYTISDNRGATASAEVTVEVVTTDVLTAQPDSISTPKNTVLSVDSASLLGNDIDPSAQGLTLVSVNNGSGGTVSLQGSTIEFVPDTDFAGAANFSYTVQDSTGAQASATVNVDVVNQAPVAAADAVSTNVNQALTIPTSSLLSNDSDPDLNDSIVFDSLGSANNGVVSLDATGESVIFTPTTDFTGVAEFNYSIQDSSGATSSAVVTVDVLAAADSVQAVADSFTSTVDQVFTTDGTSLLSNDSFSSTDLQAAATVSSVSNAVNGQVRFDSSTQQVSFVPSTGFIGDASFDYTLTANGLSSTGTVTLTIAGQALVAVDDSGFFTSSGDTLSIDINSLLNNDENPNGNALSLTTLSNVQGGTAQISALNTVEFTADPTYVGIASFDYEVTDGTEVSQASVLIDVQTANQAPTAVADQFDIPFNQTVTLSTFELLQNDTDPDPTDLLSFVDVQNVPTGLTVTVSGDTLQIFTDYQSLADLSSTQFQYVITDGTQEAIGTVTLNADNVLQGTTGADNLTTSASTQEIVTGLAGNDTFGTPTGPDILLGDAGDDLFLLQPDTAAGATLDGGAGSDSLSLSGDGQVLNLVQNNSLSSDQALNLSGIDEIDLSAGSNNQLIIGLNDVLSMSDSGSLLIEGNSSSVVTSVGEGWTNNGQVALDGALYNSYTASGAELLVSNDVVLQFIS